MMIMMLCIILYVHSCRKSMNKSIERYQLTTIYRCQTMIFINLLLDKFMKNSKNILFNNINIIN